ncbi:MAG: TatD family hydrolase [Bacilli bacterium]
MYFETHCHLNDKQFSEDLGNCIENALSNGCVGFNIVGWDLESSKAAIEIASAHKEIIATVGLHPQNCLEAPKDELANIVELIGADTDKKIKAIGEIGLDYYWDKDEDHHRIQRQFFEKQIQLANIFDLPIVVHSRDALMDTYEVLRENPVRRRGVIHCFSGSPEMAGLFVHLGFLIGIGGVVTFKNSKAIKDVVAEIPLQYLVVETDSPYLTPEPHRGKRNEPSYIPNIIEEIARIKGISTKEVEEVTTENARILFNML